MYRLNRLFTEDDKLLLRILSKTVSYEMLYEGMSAKYQMPYYNFFVDLIEGTLTDSRIVEENLKNLGVRLPDQPCLVLVELRNSAAQAAGYISEIIFCKNCHTLTGSSIREIWCYLSRRKCWTGICWKNALRAMNRR